jgi:hypothetical protein
VAGGLVASLRARSLLAAAPVKKSATDLVHAGQHRHQAVAAGDRHRHPRREQDLGAGAPGINGFAELLCHAYDQGLRFWESADQYGTHPHLREGCAGWARTTWW